MAKKIQAIVKLQIEGGAATAAGVCLAQQQTFSAKTFSLMTNAFLFHNMRHNFPSNYSSCSELFIMIFVLFFLRGLETSA